MMVTVSTSNETSRSYHHGDLRSALIEAGLSALEGVDAEAISLRELARGVGVSATAVYRHFPEKRALLAALAEAGIARLGAAQRVASEAAGGGAAGFAATGRAYVRFALANPALFRLAFTHGEFSDSHGRGDDEATLLLRGYAAQFAGPDAERLALQARAVAHGLAMLMLDGLLPPDDALIVTVIDTATLFRNQGNNSEASP
jgi:AcrR family transcriptional regulator